MTPNGFCKRHGLTPVESPVVGLKQSSVNVKPQFYENEETGQITVINPVIDDRHPTLDDLAIFQHWLTKYNLTTQDVWDMVRAAKGES